MNISETDNTQDLGPAREVAQFFRIDSARTEEILGEVRSAIRDWQAVAKKLGISGNEQERMAPAFERARP